MSTRAVGTGIAGLSIEDSTGDSDEPLFPLRPRGRASGGRPSAIDATAPACCSPPAPKGSSSDARICERRSARLTAYAEAGADCLYAPGIRTTRTDRAVVRAVAPKPVNVLVGAPFTTVDELTALGVRRISVGGALARAAWAGFLGAAKEIAQQGTFTAFSGAVPFPRSTAMFEP